MQHRAMDLVASQREAHRILLPCRAPVAWQPARRALRRDRGPKRVGHRASASFLRGVTLYEETVATVRTLAERASSTENVLFCEQRPLTSLEARFAGAEDLARTLRELEDDAIRALGRLVDAEEGYETALESIEGAGAETGAWLRAVMLARSLETLQSSP